MSTEVELENKVELRNVVALEVCNNGSDVNAHDVFAPRANSVRKVSVKAMKIVIT